MRIHVIACRIFNREFSYYAARSPHIIDITWLPQGLHDTPDLLRRMIGEAIDQLYNQYNQCQAKHMPEVIVLGYGLCSNGVVGIQARDIPIVVPRTDDCIALFLGSQARYLQLFETHSGTYWLNNGWIESAFIPSSEMLAARRDAYTEAYGEDNADYLLQQDQLWTKNYTACGYIVSPTYQQPHYAALAQRVAEENGWRYEAFEGNSRLIERLLSGHWNEDEFLVCPPGYRIAAAYDGSKVCAQKDETGE